MAKLTGTMCFSILVAADHGQRCNALRARLRDGLLRRGASGQIDVLVWKQADRDSSAHRQVGLRVAALVRDFLADVPRCVFAGDGDYPLDSVRLN